MVRARLGENGTRLTDDPDYMKNYHKAHYRKNFCKAVIQINCENCGSECTVQKLKRHQTTSLCKRRGDIIARILEEEREEELRKAKEVMDEVNDSEGFKAFLRAFIKDKHEEKEKQKEKSHEIV